MSVSTLAGETAADNTLTNTCNSHTRYEAHIFCGKKNLETVKANTIQEVIKAIYSIDYKYNDTSPNLSAILDLTTLMANKPPKTLLGTNKTTGTVGSNQEFTQTVPLNPQFRSQLESNQLFTKDGLSQPQYLEVSVTYTGRPLGIYEVYLNLPNEQEAKKAAIADIDTYFLGAMAFFVLESDRPTSKTFLFDITDELLQQIKKFKEFNLDSLSISIIKNSGPVDETITVNKLDIYTRE
ncbi:hypothetical protein [Okeania sp. KiyG1]|uniref:DUF7868 domain-containing protein n=1 Tax=Okeania sp. KiyG1 TaxID=2720165 RepID=UPI0019211FCA|nr:hypothetical protein [Okeania sp. KiyG1]GGA34939.1 hypothetical protein CYANOKiyG1_52450 [Okeania sp. KiyG1]